MKAGRSDVAARAGVAIPDTAILGGISPAIRALQLVIADMAAGETPLLIVGEPGSGRRTCASLIHNMSRHRYEPFTVVNCESVDTNFFHAGSYGPAAATFSRAGTVLLHNVNELSRVEQRGLLKVLTSGTARTRVRVMSSSTEDIEESMGAGRFEEELYHWISGIHIRVPPLRHRKEDIAMIVQWLLQKHAHVAAAQPTTISAECLQYLIDYPWPGNIAQLDEVVYSILLTGNEKAVLETLGSEKAERCAGHSPMSLKECAKSASRRAERKLILEALARTHWNKKKAAQELQISYKALLYKLKEIGTYEDTTVSEERA